jgi:hypothetical protein
LKACSRRLPRSSIFSCIEPVIATDATAQVPPRSSHSRVPEGEPQPVTASHPGAAR